MQTKINYLTKMIAQAQMRTHLKYNSTPMRSFTHQWNLSRIFGSQSVGSASSRSWPEAGIATRIIPAQSSRWTLHGQGDVFCRLADLPTWRPANLATCRLADLPTCRFWSLVTPGAPTRAFFSLPQRRRFLGRPTTPVSSFQVPATFQRSVPMLVLGTIRHPSSPPISREIARN